MARISAYPKNLPVQPEDYWIGTRAKNLVTRNFTAEAVGEYINITGTISISACMLYKFEISGAGEGDITGVPNLTQFSDITSLNINVVDISGQNTVGFLEYIVGTEILISEQDEISTFGHYNIESYTQIGTTTFYTLNLTFIGGSGYIEKKKIYNTCSFVLSSEDNNTTYDLDSIQNGPNSDIRLIGSDLTENIVKLEAGNNVTLTDTGSNILIDVTSAGTVTSIDASIDGDSLSIAGVPITSSGTIAFNWEGTDLQYVDGEGNLQTFPTLPTGTVTSVGQTHAGNAFSVAGSPITTSGVLAITLNGDNTQYIDGAGDLQTFPAIPVVPTNIVETVDTTNGTYIDLTPTTPTTGDVIVTADLSAVDGTGAPVGERYLSKNNKWETISSIPGTYEWEIQGDTGGPTVVNSTDIVTFVGGTSVSTSLVGTTLTINATDTNTTYNLTVPIATTDITLLGSDASSDPVTLTGGTNITVTRISDSELSIDGTDLNTTYDLEGVGSTNGTAGVRLAGSDATNDDVLIVGSGTTLVTRSGNTLTVTSNDQFTGTVTSVDAGITGDALSISGVPFTTSGSIDFSWDGTDLEYVDGEGNLQTFPAIPTVGDGTLTVQGTGVLGGTGTFTANQAGNTTISVTHNTQAQSNTTPSTTLTHGGTFTALSSNVGVNSSGHVTGQELTTFTLPTIPTNIVERFSNNNTGTYVAYGITNSLATGDVSIGNVDLTAVDGTAITGERYLTKSNTWATVASIPGTYSWFVAGDSGSESVSSGDTISFVGGTNVTTSYDTVSNELTINSTDQFQGTVTSVSTTHAGNAFTASIGNVATVNPSVDITMNGSSVQYIDGLGNLQAFPAIPQGDITDVNGGTYITTVNSTGPVVTVNHDLTSRSDTTSTATPEAGEVITTIDSVTTNSTGHVEAVNLKSVTLPEASKTSESVDLLVKNISVANGGVNLSKGDPVYIYGDVGASPRLLIDLADADSTATNNLGDDKMPVVGLLDQDLSPNGEGTATVVGKLRNLITSPIDGVTPWENATLYVKVGGGLTLYKPTGPDNLIQNVGQVGRISTSNDGNIVVAALLRSNDIPNLPEGRIWVGDSNTVVSDTVYFDETNERMGIGTITPDAKLEVVGTTGVIIDSGTSAQAKLTLKGDGSAYGGGALIDVIGGSSDYMAYGLNVKRSPNTMEAINLYDMANSRWTWDGNIGVTRAQPYTSYDFKTQGSSQMVIYNNNVGIGVTAPSQKLHVNGSARVTGAYYDSSNSPGAANSVLISTISGTVWGARGPLGSGTTNYLARWTPDANTLGIGVTYDDGTNVGIGTTSPGSKLTVDGTTRLGGDVEVSELLTGDKVLTLTASSGSFNIGDIDGLVDEAFISGDGSSISISANQTTTLHCSSNNRVGIGTTTPGYNLDVSGDAYIDETLNIETTVSGTLVYGYSGVGAGNLVVGGFNFASFTPAVITLMNQDTTINPGQDLGVLQFGGKDDQTNGYANGQIICTTAVGAGSGNTGGGIFRFLLSGNTTGSGPTERMRITNTGNVGIGTTNAGEKLTVAGNISVTSPNSFLVKNGDSNHGLKYGYNTFASNPTDGPVLYGYDAGGLGTTRNSENIALYWNYLGNVGVGTTTPSSKLQVNGGVQLANDTASPSASKVGTFRYRTSGNNSYVDMCMQTGASTYAWVNIVTNSW